VILDGSKSSIGKIVLCTAIYGFTPQDEAGETKNGMEYMKVSKLLYYLIPNNESQLVTILYNSPYPHLPVYEDMDKEIYKLFSFFISERVFLRLVTRITFG